MTAQLQPITTKHPSAVVISDGRYGPHIGISYRCTKKKVQRVLHCAWHFMLIDEAQAPSDRLKTPMVVKPSIDPEELRLLALFCTKRASYGPQDIPYGFRYSASTFADDGRFMPGPGETGLTCATFVVAMFDWARIRLLDVATWEPRAEDAPFFRKVIAELEATKASAELLAAWRKETVGTRIRPEEAAACSAMEGRPVAYKNAKPAGEALTTLYYETVSG